MKVDRILFITLLMYGNCLHAQSWKEVNPPPNIFNDDIFSISIDSSKNIYAAGKFKNQNNEYIIAEWDGRHWAELGVGNNALKANNVIYSVLADKGGNVYAAGGFTNSAGNTSIAKWDGTTWSEVGGIKNELNPNGEIYAMTEDNNGDLFVAGSIIDSLGKEYVAEWNGSKWSEVGTGSNSLSANGFIYSLITDTKGNVYAAGQFTDANGTQYVAKWDGTAWRQLDHSSPLHANGYISCLGIDSAGNLYAGGGFKDSTNAYYIAKWNGNDWRRLDGGANGPFNVMIVTADGNVYAGGYGTDSTDNTEISEWNDNKWNELFKVNNAIRAMSIDKTGNLYVAGDFKDGDGYGYIAEWDGISMKKAGFQGEELNTNNGIYDVAVDTKGNVYATGDFKSALGTYYLAQWDGKTWSSPGGDTATLGLNYSVIRSVRMATDLSGNLYVTGNFTDTKGRYYIAKWNGESWSELGTASNPIKLYEPVSAFMIDKKDNVYAGGVFGDSNGFSYGILKWNDSSETYYHTNDSPYSLVVDSAGNIYAGMTEGGKYDVAEIQRDKAIPLGNGSNALNSASPITAIAIDKKGNILASGSNNEGYSPYNKFVAIWDGRTWSKAGVDSTGRYTEGYVTSMLSDDSGNVYAASATNANAYFSVAKWNGSSWSELGKPFYFNSLINAIAIDDSDNIYAAGLFGSGVQYVAEYRQSEISLPLDTPMVSALANQYCGAASEQSFQITNLPDTSRVAIAVKLDTNSLPLHAGGIITFNPQLLSPGLHEIKLSYSTPTDSTLLIKDFKVIEPIRPVVKLNANTLILTNNKPVIITALNVAGGGPDPQFIFSKDRDMNLILKPASYDNTVSLNASELALGDNMIYVTMITSDRCYSTQTAVDSIHIKRIATAGITDPDYPDQKIVIYPNPFNKILEISGFQVSKSYTISITNSLGMIILRKVLNGSNNLEISRIGQAGIYWMTVYDNTKNRVLGSIGVIKN